MHNSLKSVPLFLAVLASVILTRWGIVGGAAPAASSAPAAQSPQKIDGLRIATFDLDATPPVGSRLTYDPMVDTWPLGLRCRGIILSGGGDPVVLCAVDWIGIANEGHDAFRSTLAKAAGTSADRVAVHVLHQHDAPICDFTTERILKDAGMNPEVFDSTWQRQWLQRLGGVVAKSLTKSQPVTHVGCGEAPVEKVASNRRILGPDGKVRATRFTACKDPALRDEPEGLIDPIVTSVSFWNEAIPLVALTYYATHPQSYYRTGIANPDFPGLARFQRDQETSVLHVHFNGAAGNIGAGKYNDGSMANRAVLANKVAAGMKAAWDATKKMPISARDVQWKSVPVALPPSPGLKVEELQAALKPGAGILSAATQLAWLERCGAGHKIDLQRLRLGTVDILHLPGELFVEYQLEAKKKAPHRKVAMAAYGEYAPGYIGTEISYGQGGYETEPRSSFVAPAVEKVLLDGILTLLAD